MKTCAEENKKLQLGSVRSDQTRQKALTVDSRSPGYIKTIIMTMDTTDRELSDRYFYDSEVRWKKINVIRKNSKWNPMIFVFFFQSSLVLQCEGRKTALYEMCVLIFRFESVNHL